MTDKIRPPMILDKLDRLAAEKVMGIEYTPGVFMRGTEEYWQPTHNIAQAWECLEKLRLLAYSIKLEGDGMFRCSIQKFDESKVSTTIHAETAPLAIVKACLKAMGVEI